MQRQILIIIATAALFAATQTHAQGEDGWRFTVEPYLVATSINGDASVGRVVGVPVDVSFSDILENLDMAGMLHFEAQHGNGWGVVFDYGFMDLGADTSVGFGGILDASVRQGILELLVTRDVEIGATSMEVLAGVRSWSNKLKVSLDPAIWNGSLSTRVSEDWVDPVVGLRWTGELAERWRIRLRGDIGGLGVGSDFSWNASATALYNISDRFELEFGYKALDVDYDNGKAADNGSFVYDTTTHGPLLGLLINF